MLLGNPARSLISEYSKEIEKFFDRIFLLERRIIFPIETDAIRTNGKHSARKIEPAQIQSPFLVLAKLKNKYSQIDGYYVIGQLWIYQTAGS